jgi:hypothetical protein
MQRNVVVLPQPLGPNNEKNSPSRTSNEIGPTLTCGEYRFVRLRTSSSTPAGIRRPGYAPSTSLFQRSRYSDLCVFIFS